MSNIVETSYISCACNRTPGCVDWGLNGLIVFGACQSIALYNPQKSVRIVSTCHAHKDRVNAVRWIRGSSVSSAATGTEFVSTSLDKMAIIWKLDENECKVACILQGHTGSVNAVDAVYVGQPGGNSSLLIATASADCTVKIWQRSTDCADCACLQTISLGQGLVLSLALVLLPNVSIPMLACGRDDSKLCIYIQQNSQFTLVRTLVGHEQWIRSLSFTIDDGGDVLLASAGQDSYIRLWRISSKTRETVPDETELKLQDATFSVQLEGVELKYAIMLESVLFGHENWIYSVQWHPPLFSDGQKHQPMSLLSASMDKTMVIWQPHGETGVWTEKVRVGEVGGSNLGFYGGLFGPDGSSVLAHGYQGAFHLWHHSKETDTWLSGVTSGGHFDSVNDIVWGRNGEFLLSVSSDQTARLHAVWKSADTEMKRVWHEIARPQIHGYDIQCVALIDRFQFASGADEKIVRIFTAPKNFLQNYSSICQVDVESVLKKMEGLQIAEGASVPALGLSNKAVFVGSEAPSNGSTTESKKSSDEQYTESYFTPQTLFAPPSEENLLQNTLWPELQKLYGHGNELYAIDCSRDGKLLASACKASKPDQAAIIIWNTDTWRPLCQLESHTLTVTQLAFSHNGQFLLSVSRDRTWTVFEQQRRQDADVTDVNFKKVACPDKKTAVHSRIIWSCAWSHDDVYFVTVSRDKKAVIWENGSDVAVEESKVPACLGGRRSCSAALELDDSITAVDFGPSILSNDRYLLSMGLENGSIHILTWSAKNPQSLKSWCVVCTLDRSIGHHLTVKRLKFRQQSATGDSNIVQLASCGSDHIVKIYDCFLDRIPQI